MLLLPEKKLSRNTFLQVDIWPNRPGELLNNQNIDFKILSVLNSEDFVPVFKAQ